MKIRTDNPLQEERTIQFFKEIKSDLGSKSTQKIVRLVRAVLSQIRRSLSHEQATLFIKNLPSLFQLLFVVNWKYAETSTSIGHLDELVDTLYEEDQKSDSSLFYSEIDTLNKVILVMTKLDKFFGIMGLKVFRYELAQELKQAVKEDAA